MEQLLQLVELVGRVILVGLFALAPGVILWLVVTGVVMTARRLRHTLLESKGVAHKKLLFT